MLQEPYLFSEVNGMIDRMHFNQQISLPTFDQLHFINNLFAKLHALLLNSQWFDRRGTLEILFILAENHAIERLDYLEF